MNLSPVRTVLLGIASVLVLWAGVVAFAWCVYNVLPRSWQAESSARQCRAYARVWNGAR